MSTTSAKLPSKSAVVIGGGFIGISSAIHLCSRGFAVTVLEKARSGVGSKKDGECASYGNAGTFAPYATFGLNDDSPASLLSAGVKAFFGGSLMFGSTKSGDGDVLANPLSFSLSASNASEVMKFAMHFLRNSSAENRVKTNEGLSELCKRASSSWKETLRLAGVNDARAFLEEHANRNGYLLLTKSRFDSKEVIEKNEERKRLLGDKNIWNHEGEGELIGPEMCKQLEPNLTDSAVANGGVYFKDAWSLRAPDVFLKKLAEFALKMKGPSGGSVVIKAGSSGEVVDVRGEQQNDEKAEIVTKSGDVYTNVHTIVVCSGWRSKEIAKMCGDGDIPLIAERGYSVEFSDTEQVSPSKLLTRATCFQRGGFIISPLQSRLRAAGLVEFGPDQPPTASNLLSLESSTRKLLRNFSDAPPRNKNSDWLGGRPTLPDYLPVLSRSSAKSNVIYAFGHQHIGFTLAGITGKIVADIATTTGAQQRGDDHFPLEPYALQRFL